MWLVLFVDSSLSRAYALFKRATPDHVEPFLRVAVAVVVVGLVSWSIHTIRSKPNPHMVVGAADGLDLPAAFARCISIANAKHARVLELESELAAIRSATRVSEDKVVETRKPKVVRMKPKRETTFIEDVFGQ